MIFNYKKSLFLYFVSIYFLYDIICGEESITFGCEDEFKNDFICANAICDPVDCKEGTLIPGGGWCGCCDNCAIELKEYESCNPIYPEIAPIRTHCSPGLICDKQHKICRPLKTSPCLKLLQEYKKANETAKLSLYEPSCDVNGRFEGKQCRGTMCFCVTESGAEIEFRRIPRPESQNMNCECARAHAKGEKHLRCLPNGNYDSLQCKDEFCYCIDKHQRQTGNAVYKSFIQTLPCYEDSTFKNHLSPCQEQLQDIAKRIKDAKAKGITLLGDDKPTCLADGSYSPFQCRGADCFCVTRSGKFIPNYRQNKPQALSDKMKCICASENNDLADGLAVSIGFSCHVTSGNFQPKQCPTAECYCVDPLYGYRKGPSADFEDLVCS